MGERRGGSLGLLVIGFVAGWAFAVATRTDEPAPSFTPPPAETSSSAPAPAPYTPRAASPPIELRPATPPPVDEQESESIVEQTSEAASVVPEPEPESVRVVEGPSDGEIRRLIIERSLANYSGSCPCPYNVDRAGRSCGARSAYSRPGGASPLCYPSDVTDTDVQRFRLAN